MRWKYPALILLVSVILISCSRCTLSGIAISHTATILSYNVENLFDDRDDGSEYSDYDPGTGSWNTALYHAKLQNVAEAILAAGKNGPDICLLQEIENERVVTDLLEGYLNVLKYRYAVTAPKNGTATTVAILSRFKPESVLVHSIYVDDKVPLRPILEVRFDLRDHPLALFNNHWKSKSGGAMETESYRIAAAAFIRTRVAAIRNGQPDMCVIIAGDLNERVDESLAVGEAYPTALTIVGDAASPAAVSIEQNRGPVETAADRETALELCGSWTTAENNSGVLFSPWFETAYGGSYAYAGEWERIDHFLIAPALDHSGITYEDFEVIAADVGDLPTQDTGHRFQRPQVHAHRGLLVRGVGVANLPGQDDHLHRALRQGQAEDMYRAPRQRVRLVGQFTHGN